MLPKTFIAKDGREVVLRPPKWEDLEDLTKYINSLVDEKVDICRATKVTREEEAEWLKKRLTSIDKGEVIHIVSEVNGEVVAGGEVKKQRDLMSHVGMLGIGVKAGFRSMGIGTVLMDGLIEESKKAGLKILVLDVFDTNEIAKALYEKMGFKVVGKLPKGIYRNGKYIDLVRMVLELL